MIRAAHMFNKIVKIRCYKVPAAGLLHAICVSPLRFALAVLSYFDFAIVCAAVPQYVYISTTHHPGGWYAINAAYCTPVA